MDNERELKERILKLFEETDRRSEEQEAYIQELRQKLSLAEKAALNPAASIVKQDVTKNAMMPAMVNHDYRNIKIDASTTVTIDLEDIKKQLAEDFYRSQGLWL